jgi:Icc-related predicted phosphoesterase
MIIAATSDIHSPRYLNQFFQSFNGLKDIKVDLFLLAGDLSEKGEFNHFYPVYSAVKKYKTVAVFGNEDFQDKREFYKKHYPEIIWLEDEKVDVNINGVSISIVGSDGVLREPTKWQKLNGMDEEYYRKKREIIEELLCDAKGELKILLTHYASSYSTIVGERKEIFPQLGDRVIEEAKCLPNIAIHGHAHYAKVTFSVVRNVKVYNVALPANKKIVLIRLSDPEVTPRIS